ncbi:hypothetical protein TI03_06145 [Achromatium sp. WMS1]|nr:hypothetical protein TI03_06145 [Achromatium sp. WMS1]
MSIIRYYLNKWSLDELTTRYQVFSKIKHAQIKSSRFEWQDVNSGLISYHALAVFLGKTGYGKSSTINTIFGTKLMETHDISSCTKTCQSLDFELSPNCFFSLSDLPGIGDNELNDREYIRMYKDFLNSAIVAVYIIRADTRDYSVDISTYNEVFANGLIKDKVILGLNFCDKIEPINRNFSVAPTAMQMDNIAKKVNHIENIFQPSNRVVPYSAETGWNVSELTAKIVKIV